MDPKVTIVTPTLNQGKFIEQTILSVLNQTYPNIEYIIVDGGSTDQTVDILEKYKGRFTLIRGQDKGQADAINIGFRAATGELVGWLNSDDLLDPNAVELVVQRYRQNPHAAVYLGLARLIDEHGRVLGVPKQIPLTFDNILHGRPCFSQPGSFYSRRLVERVGYLDENLIMHMDTDLMLRLTRVGTVEFIPQVLASLRRHSGSKTLTRYWDRVREGLMVRRRHGASLFVLFPILLRYLKTIIGDELRKRHLSYRF
ncbi:MAG: glycosyltransferase family 2 protein [Candidatus Methanomethylicaceae archaeon]